MLRVRTKIHRATILTCYNIISTVNGHTPVATTLLRPSQCRLQRRYDRTLCRIRETGWPLTLTLTIMTYFWKHVSLFLQTKCTCVRREFILMFAQSINFSNMASYQNTKAFHTVMNGEVLTPDPLRLYCLSIFFWHLHCRKIYSLMTVALLDITAEIVREYRHHCRTTLENSGASYSVYV